MKLPGPLGPGARNLITDVAGIAVGQSADPRLRSGVTVLVGDRPLIAGVHVMGGAPGTRETDLLAPDKVVSEVHALVLAGGSAFGLDAASGVAEALRRAGTGLRVGPALVPIVPAAIVFDLANGGDKDWTTNPYADLGARALAGAGPEIALGTAGAGAGALTATLKGGVGSASVRLASGHTIGALAVVNAIGSVLWGEGPHFRAAHEEMDGEFGGLGAGPPPDPRAAIPIKSPGGSEATTIAILATDAALDKAGATRMAIAAHDGIARAIWPSHTARDGDLVFAVSTGARVADADALLAVAHAGASTLARAIARGVHAASPATGDLRPAWSQRFGR